MLIFRIALAAMACAPASLFSQAIYLPGGARSQALGNASVTFRDPWSVVNNIGACGFVKDAALAATFESRFGISNLNSASFIGLVPFKHFSAAINLGKFGNNAYSEQCLSLGLAHKTGNISFGFKLNYFQVTQSESKTEHALIAEFGGLATVTKQLVFGAHIYNLSKSSITYGGSRHLLPVAMKAGISYSPNTKIQVNAEAKKVSQIPVTCSFGIEYLPIPQIAIRTGITGYPYINHFGAGFNHLHFRLDYSFSLHQALGAIHQVSICYKFKKER